MNNFLFHTKDEYKGDMLCKHTKTFRPARITFFDESAIIECSACKLTFIIDKDSFCNNKKLSLDKKHFIIYELHT